MKIAVLYNRRSRQVINHFGIPSREKYGLASIQRVVTALERGGHEVAAFEADKHLPVQLETFMPKALTGERPGLVFNLAYGIQGQARYTHVPALLEMLGLPYVASDPLGHALALDKVVAKMIFLQHGIPTPEFAVLEDENFRAPQLEYPLVVKPKNEAVSFGLRVVYDEAELREAASNILREFGQAVLAERYIEGREINVGLLGNGAPEALPVAELVFAEGPRIYTEADKKGKTGGRVSVRVPAEVEPHIAARAQEIARRAFTSLGLRDCARVDMRLDADGRLWVLEINSLPSLGEHGSYAQAAAAAGLDFTALVHRLVDVATTRVFGTRTPAPSPRGPLLEAVSAERDAIERSLEARVAAGARADEPESLRQAAEEFGACVGALGLTSRRTFGDGRTLWLYETAATCRGGTLLLVPLASRRDDAPVAFRREPEWLYGEGVGTCAARTVVEFALRTVASTLPHARLGVVLCAGDVAGDPRLVELATEAAHVLVVEPTASADRVITGRRGQRRYRLRASAPSRRIAGTLQGPLDPVPWFVERAAAIAALPRPDEHTTIEITAIHTHADPGSAPHRLDADVVVSFADPEAGARLAASLQALVEPEHLRFVAEHPAMLETAENTRLAEALRTVAGTWDLPLVAKTSVVPSIAGGLPPSVPVACGLGPAIAHPNTEREAVRRASLVQRTLLLAAWLERAAAS